jgi:hypothetical protein
MVIYQSNHNTYEAINNDDNTMFYGDLIDFIIFCVIKSLFLSK